ncbi:septal ring lytic transglycosylase RlpA family protein [Sphingomonas sp. MA1305]|uniref:septal ring lytic transglycosylase RlpA family protein n=1 Tax=unclassified Sphingomonas TaxID=196159 RepID=UPI0018E00BCD|nr:septal ring lytic transglycosylase RlpA family protein [Sphingomonas sp. MA1305]MBI0475506.1 septal ring lytic transglycosylase RlpA family protein [Sphingomonas sp. MA1305]
MPLRRLTPLAVLVLAGCAGGYRPVSDTPVQIGRPYSVRGHRYVPAPAPDYDMLGYASWYGGESGHRTALGEKFRARWLTGAHRTLPLPTYVEVTSLATGRRILVRINDRGPFAGGDSRIIDLAQGAANELGLTGSPAAVRVRVVTPDEGDRARLRRGKAATPLPPVAEDVLQSFRAQLAASHH